MTSELDELYQSVILDHNRTPRNFHKLEDATAHAEGRNPLCGDVFDVWLKVADERIVDVAFLGQGCAISKASASMMTAALKGKSVDEAREMFREFHDMVTGESDPETGEHHLGKLTLFKGVREYSSRIKCASLAWHALMGALEKQSSATTEGAETD